MLTYKIISESLILESKIIHNNLFQIKHTRLDPRERKSWLEAPL